jgi:poly(A) polymerase
VRPRPLITGRELIAAGYKPGEKFREMLREAEDAQLEGAVTTADEALQLVRERFPREPSAPGVESSAAAPEESK